MRKVFASCLLVAAVLLAAVLIARSVPIGHSPAVAEELKLRMFRVPELPQAQRALAKNARTGPLRNGWPVSATCVVDRSGRPLWVHYVREAWYPIPRMALYKSFFHRPTGRYFVFVVTDCSMHAPKGMPYQVQPYLVDLRARPQPGPPLFPMDLEDKTPWLRPARPVLPAYAFKPLVYGVEPGMVWKPRYEDARTKCVGKHVQLTLALGDLEQHYLWDPVGLSWVGTVLRFP